MPNRILRETILDSERVDALDAESEVFYRRLMSVVDDFGRFDARPAVLKSRLYPLRLDKVREADISRWIAMCVKAGLIALYEAAGRQYILFHRLGEPRAKTSKYPAPPAGDPACAQTQADASTCAHICPYSSSPTLSNSDSPTVAPPDGGPPEPPAKRFSPPTVEEVAAYCRERGNRVDPAKFVDHYTANGWRVGKTPMKNWQAAVRTWEKNDFDRGGNKPAPADMGDRVQAEMERNRAERNNGRGGT